MPAPGAGLRVCLALALPWCVHLHLAMPGHPWYPFLRLKLCSICTRLRARCIRLYFESQGGGYLAMDCPLPAGQQAAPRLPAAPGSEAAALSGCNAATTQAPVSGGADSEGGLEANSDSVVDEAALPAQAARNPAATCSFHIAYSASYGVPVLLFDAQEPGVPSASVDAQLRRPQVSGICMFKCAHLRCS